MIDLAIALALQNTGLGVLGETLFWNQSPVLSTGTVTSSEGAWVNAITVESNGDTYTDQVTVSTRFADTLAQGVWLMHAADYINNTLVSECGLSLTPLIDDCEFPIVKTGKSTSMSLDAVDNEGRFVKSIQFQIKYKYPSPLPSLR